MKHRLLAVVILIVATLSMVGAAALLAPHVRDGKDDFVPQDKEIVAMSFNIRTYGIEDQPHKFWNHRKQGVVDLVIRHAPDIIGFQEVKDVQLEYLVESLTDYAYYSKNAWDDHPLSPLMGGANSIFYKKERFELVSQKTLWLSDTPETVSPSWGTNELDYRTLNQLLLKDKLNNKTLTIINTHLGLTGYTQEKSCRMLISIANQTEGPIIIMGDFNHQQDTPLYELMVEGKLADSNKIAADGDEGGTFHGFAGRLDKPWPKPIDFIFVTDSFFCASYRIVRERNQDNQYPSDHYPIKAILTYKEY